MATAIINTKGIREKLFNLINGFDDERLYYLYEFLKPQALLNDGAEEAEDTTVVWTEKFIAELDRRREEYENGGKGYTMEEMEARTEILLKTLRAEK